MEQYYSKIFVIRFRYLIIKATMKDLIGNHTSKQLAASLGSRNAFYNS